MRHPRRCYDPVHDRPLMILLAAICRALMTAPAAPPLSAAEEAALDRIEEMAAP